MLTHGKKSLIIHEGNTKQITTVAEVLYVIKIHLHKPGLHLCKNRRIFFFRDKSDVCGMSVSHSKV